TRRQRTTRTRWAASYRSCHLSGGKVLLPAPHAALVDRDAKAGTIRHRNVSVGDAKRLDRDVLGKARAGDGEAPGERRRDRGHMRSRRRGDTRFTGLAGNIDAHAERRAQPARFEQGAQSAELDRFQAYALGGAALMMALDVVA